MITELERKTLFEFDDLLSCVSHRDTPDIVRDEDYKYIITFHDGLVVDFYTKSNWLFIREKHEWVNDGIGYLRKKLLTNIGI